MGASASALIDWWGNPGCACAARVKLTAEQLSCYYDFQSLSGRYLRSDGFSISTDAHSVHISDEKTSQVQRSFQASWFICWKFFTMMLPKTLCIASPAAKQWKMDVFKLMEMQRRASWWQVSQTGRTWQWNFRNMKTVTSTNIAWNLFLPKMLVSCLIKKSWRKGVPIASVFFVYCPVCDF